jgi:hypothetical protein
MHNLEVCPKSGLASSILHTFLWFISYLHLPLVIIIIIIYNIFTTSIGD